MPKTPKPQNSAIQLREFYSLHPWQCQDCEDRSEITAYVEASGEWETILTVHPTSGASAEVVATYVASIINRYQNKTDLLQEAMAALELCLEEDGLTFSSEQLAEKALISIKRSLQ